MSIRFIPSSFHEILGIRLKDYSKDDYKLTNIHIYINGNRNHTARTGKDEHVFIYIPLTISIHTNDLVLTFGMVFLNKGGVRLIEYARLIG